MTWRRLLCAFTFHTWRSVLAIDGHTIQRCTFCGGERAL